MFCAYNDYLHITAKTLPSYRIKDDSNFASSTAEIAAIALQFLLREQTKALRLLSVEVTAVGLLTVAAIPLHLGEIYLSWDNHV